jgi:transcriptional regulator with XRE-family HTH domain
MKASELNKKVGATINRLRKKRGWTLVILADKIETDKSNLIAMEKGRENLTLATIAKVAKALEVEPFELLK